MSQSVFKNAFPQIPGVDKICAELPTSSHDVTYGNAIACNTETDRETLGFFRYSPLEKNAISCQQCAYHRVQIWRRKEDKITSYTQACSLNQEKLKNCKNIAFHPYCSQVISCVSDEGITVSDLERPDATLGPFGGEGLYNLSWKADGSTIAAIRETGQFLTVDPRKKAESNVIENSCRKASILWAGQTDYILQFGFDPRLSTRSCYIWDTRNLSKYQSRVDIDQSSSIFYPVFDPDTGMISVGNRGTFMCHYMQFDGSKLSQVRTDSVSEETYGWCQIPRTHLDVMSCEVMRILQLGKASISHISYEVMRKNKSTFYPELYPDAPEPKSSLTSQEWFSGQNKDLGRVQIKPTLNITQKPVQAEQNIADVEEDDIFTPRKIVSDENMSKFKFISGVPLHKKFSHDLPNNIELKSNSESNGMSVNLENIAVLLTGTSGRVGILKLSKPGRIPLENLHYVEQGSHVLDFQLDLKDDNLLAVLCENSALNIWKLPPDGLQSVLTTPTQKIMTSSDKPTILKFHPCASGIISTTGIDGIIRIWDFSTAKSVFSSEDKEKSQTLSIGWNESGSSICSVFLDHSIRIHDPRSSRTAVLSSSSFTGSGPSRITYLEDNSLFVTGITSNGVRAIGTKDLRKFQEFDAHLTFDASPSVLNPYYDPDIKVVYLCPNGECSITPVEIRKDSVGFMELARYISSEPQQAVCMLRKDLCDIKNIEVAKFVRLVSYTTEIISFTVPRTKGEYFQDDIFPPTREVWKSSMTSKDYIDKRDKLQGLYDLQPKGMQKLSEADFGDVKPPKYNSRAELKKSVKIAEEGSDILGMVRDKVKLREDDPIEYEERQGISDSEWDD